MPTTPHTPRPHPNRTRFFLYLLIPCLTACQTLAPLPPTDLTQPGWQVRRGQAVWLTSHHGTELAGDLLFASHPDRHSLLEFTKASWPLVLVRLTPDAWKLESDSTGQRHSGRGSPPPRSAWLVLPLCLAGKPPPAGWHFSRDSANGWTLSHHRSGEQLSGYLLP